ncbi:MAG: hypothetical protein IPH42_20865 [Bacteroidetes bacterium]|nr:hypothetical protein [Bacteroidota bacterium]
MHLRRTKTGVNHNFHILKSHFLPHFHLRHLNHRWANSSRHPRHFHDWDGQSKLHRPGDRACMLDGYLRKIENEPGKVYSFERDGDVVEVDILPISLIFMVLGMKNIEKCGGWMKILK